MSMEEDDCVDFDCQLESSTLATVDESDERGGYYRCANRHPLIGRVPQRCMRLECFLAIKPRLS